MSVDLAPDILRAITGRLPHGWIMTKGKVSNGLVCVTVAGQGKAALNCPCGDPVNCPPAEYVGRVIVTHECESISALMDEISGTILQAGLPAGTA